jgi:hypothetical protein
MATVMPQTIANLAAPIKLARLLNKWLENADLLDLFKNKKIGQVEASRVEI